MIRSGKSGLWIGGFALLFLLLLSGCGRSGEGEEKRQSAEAISADRATPHARSMLYSARESFRRGSLKKALARADSAARLEPRWTDAHFARGRILTEMKRFAAARDAFRKVIDLDPSYTGVRFNLGNNLFQADNYRSALRLYREEARLLERMQEKSGGQQVQAGLPTVYLQIGRAYNKLGQSDSARYAYERALTADDTFALAHSDLAYLYRDLGQIDSALHHARQAVKLSSDHVDSQYLLGHLLFQKGRSGDAIDYLEQVIEQHPWHYGAHHTLGQIYVRRGKPERGKQYLARADTLQDLEQRIFQLRATAEANDTPENWIRLGQLLTRSFRFQEAVQAYRSALQLKPKDSDVWTRLGAAYMEMDRPDAARKAWRRALRYDPGHQQAGEYLDQYAAQP